MSKQLYLVVKTEQIFEDGIPTGEYMPNEYEGAFATKEEAFDCCEELAETYFRSADYYSQIGGGWGYYAEKRVNDEYIFWKEYKGEMVNYYESRII